MKVQVAQKIRKKKKRASFLMHNFSLSCHTKSCILQNRFTTFLKSVFKPLSKVLIWKFSSSLEQIQPFRNNIMSTCLMLCWPKQPLNIKATRAFFKSCKLPGGLDLLVQLIPWMLSWTGFVARPAETDHIHQGMQFP